MRKHVGPFVVLVLFLSAMFLMTACAQKKVTKAEPVNQPEPEAQEVERRSGPRGESISAHRSSSMTPGDSPRAAFAGVVRFTAGRQRRR